MKVRTRIRIHDSFKGSYNLFYKVSCYFGATFQIAFEKYNPVKLNNAKKCIFIEESYSGFVFRIRIQDSYSRSYPGFV